MFKASRTKRIRRAANNAVLALLALLLAFTPLLGALGTHTVYAEETSTTDFAERFLCTEYKTSRGSAALAEDGKSIRLNFYGTGSYIEGTVTSSALGETVNALRFTVLSCTRSAQMSITYGYGNEGELDTESTCTIQLERSEAPKVYTVSLPNASELKHIRLTSEQASLTSLTLSSLLAVSAYADNTYYAGKLDSCTLNGSTVSLKGTIPTATVAARRGDMLAVYVLAHDEDFIGEDALPVKTASLSAKFEIKVTRAEGDISGTKYLVCLIDEGGAVTPVAPAMFATADGESKAAALPYKGVLSDGCTDIGAGTVLADVDLSLLIDMKHGGYAYRFEGEYFYFNRKETDRLISTVKRSAATGSETLLRLLCSNPGTEVPFTYSYNESGVFYYSLNAETAEGRKYIRAAISFLSDLLGGSDYAIYG
ncbi:MAG: hypothetical protein II370_07465, partial [Clostridia bacterium]|nr:hypothetical protein [Clostridia bacterium]